MPALDQETVICERKREVPFDAGRISLRDPLQVEHGAGQKLLAALQHAPRGPNPRAMLVEALVLSAAGAAIGLALGHLLTEVLGAALRAQQQVPVTGWTWAPGEAWLLGLALAVGVLAALLPAWRASRAEVAPVLAEG